MGDDDSFVIAMEQYLHWHELGLTHRQMLEALEFHAEAGKRHTTREVVDLIALAWHCLRRHRAA